jgi:type IV secretory pathway VirB2 component (pilin)
MKVNKILKIFLIIIILGIISILICQSVNGWNADFNQFDDADTGNSGAIVTNVLGATINFISILAAGIAIIMLIVLGIMYVMDGAEGKAEIKKSLTSYVVGAVILFAASGVLKIIQMFVDSNINNI